MALNNFEYRVSSTTGSRESKNASNESPIKNIKFCKSIVLNLFITKKVDITT